MRGKKQNRWIYDRFARILAAAIDRDADAVGDGIGEVGAELGHDGVFAVCCAMAESIRVLGFPDHERGDGSLTGDIAIIEKISDADEDNPPALWAARFVVAYMNGDRATNSALFFGPLEAEGTQDNKAAEEALITGVVTLVAMAAAMARKKEAETT